MELAGYYVPYSYYLAQRGEHVTYSQASDFFANKIRKARVAHLGYIGHNATLSSFVDQHIN